jgi:uncharacterized protein YqgV (UPF0045/DUF77 family)
LQTVIEGVRDNDLSSLQTVIEGERDADLASLQTAIESVRDSDLSSLQTVIEGERDSDLASLQTAIEGNRDSELASLQTAIDSSLAIATVGISSGAESVTLDFSDASVFGADFSSVPSIVATVKAGTNDGIIAAQLSAVSASEATFQFSEQVPNGNYSLVVMASV